MMGAVSQDIPSAELDAAVEGLVRNKQKWAQTTIEVRVQILAEIKDRLQAVAAEWAKTASLNKQIPDGSPLEGEEWVSGPYTVMAACNGLIKIPDFTGYDLSNRPTDWNDLRLLQEATNEVNG